ncbi:hypothetical protein ACIBI9_08580 [Nonomuraea sp. NPDC050451]|uniref:hypothetical protein n=1 Tax=Nonomuraea sp. NPDC050451 TaxID=3364364 RepID=UPI0037B1FDEB
MALRDGCSWDEERLRHVATIGLGRALLSRLAALVGSTMAPEAIHDEPDTTVRLTFLGRHTADEARAHHETFIAPHFTTDGATAIIAVGAELGVPATVTAAEFYRTAAP